ncbi:glyoxalase-like protein [Brevibacterium sanguinis]|uniref:Glyoxalase-like protein n=2 Tax=Brevibacterium TaxID=1696 RepID=A0A366IHZ8_9MICO|nr:MULTISPECIES: VOC family protein [Brevibacterium]RBP63451.1 glyoxalase-like protein [Brevibacterium sanguinis]RBP69918.1 glyoxalase-like protein [Brevibacterium celere]
MDDLNGTRDAQRSEDTAIPAHLDHLIVTVPDLGEAVAEVERLTGVSAVPGGRHPGRGTANFLIGLAPAGWGPGARTYLEILGPDPGQERPADGTLPLDAHLAEGLTLQTWAIHPPAFAAKVAGANTEGVDIGEVRDMSRETTDGTLLEWRLTSRTPLPDNGTQPFLIDWLDSVHPAEADLPSLDLLEFTIETPDVDATRRALQALGAGDAEVVAGSAHRLHARLRGPGGELEF